MRVDTRGDLSGAIKFKKINDNTVWIHPSAVGAIESDYSDKYSIIRLLGGCSIYVKGSPEVTMKKIGWVEMPA